MLTLNEFRATRQIMAHAELQATLGDDFADLIGGAVYADDCFIGLDEAGWILILDRDEWRGSIDELEARLYFEHYVQECVRIYDEGPLELLYREFCQWAGFVNYPDARSLLETVGLGPTNTNWLIWFVELEESLQATKTRWRVKLQRIGYSHKAAPPVIRVVHAETATEARNRAAEQLEGDWFATDIFNLDELIKEYAS